MKGDAMMKLYDSAFSPFARKVRMVLEHKGLEFEAVDGLVKAFPGDAGVLCWCNPSSVPPRRYTVWWKSGSVSSSSTGSASNSAPYHGTLTARSRTVRATCVSAGNSDISGFLSLGFL